MKNYKNISIVLVFCSVLYLLSCEKGIDMVNEDSNVYLPLSGLTEQTVLLGESVFELGVYKAGINQTNTDVTVNFKVDTEAFNEFSNSNMEYELLPEQYYDLPSASVNIPGGEERESLEIHLKGIDESYVGKKYVLPISIENTEPAVGILEEQKTVLINFTRFRNVYENLYKAFGEKLIAENNERIAVIDEEVYATSISSNTVKVNGAEDDMNLLLTIQGNNVIINGAEGSESYNIKNTEGKNSTYTGEFHPGYQRNKGVFNLYYTYVLNEQEINAEVELKFWL